MKFTNEVHQYTLETERQLVFCGNDSRNAANSPWGEQVRFQHSSSPTKEFCGTSAEYERKFVSDEERISVRTPIFTTHLMDYYALFTQDFIEEVLPATRIQLLYPFLDYAGVPFFQLSGEEAREIEEIFLAMNDELQQTYPDRNRAIKLLLGMLLLKAKRSYVRQELTMLYHNPKASSLVVRFKKLVAQHFLTIRAVSEYASKLAVSPKHLSKVIKHETDKNPSDFIDEILLMEVQCLLRYTELSVAEISYQLEFADPSHLTKFFKKHTNTTPVQCRTAAQE